MLHTPHFHLNISLAPDPLWTLYAGGLANHIQPPVFEIDGRPLVCSLDSLVTEPPRSLHASVVEHAFHGRVRDHPDLALRLVFRISDLSPVIRFRYELSRTSSHRLTKTQSKDAALYLTFAVNEFPDVHEIRFSEFQELVHAFRLSELPLSQHDFNARLSVMGPMLVASDSKGGGPDNASLLLAYEHGSQVPDAFLQFDLEPDKSIVLRAQKGNYLDGQSLREKPFSTPWFHLAAVRGDQSDLAASYRDFVLRFMSPNAASRTPYIFYNTWAWQERNKWWNDKAFLDSMNEERMLLEIDIAHRMGIDVFVIDTGWYEKTGDWRVSSKRFPRGLAPLKQKLDQYGMKLGLWFDNAAAVSRKILGDHKDCIVSWQGKQNEPHPVWETEPAHRMCLVSRYADAFADELIRLVRDTGVSYFKWDAIGQYGCDDPNHLHGNASNSPAERADSYAFQQVSFMTQIVDKLCAACPEAIVDFDITEGGRSVGLAFLSAGKYFLINNGPYYPNYDVPYDWASGKLLGGDSRWSNIFVHPGPARGWVCRTPLDFDKWIPSVLFLTHYLPDDPAQSQLINLASLMLGQNGIWGDLVSLSPEGIALFHHWLNLYKKVRGDITSASPVRRGSVGGSPEVHQKLSNAGRGLVAIFASAPGRYDHVIHVPTASTHQATDGVVVQRRDSLTVLQATFQKPGVQFVLFGV